MGRRIEDSNDANVNGASNIVSLTDAATITPNMGEGSVFRIILGGNRTIANPINNAPVDGQRILFRLRQDATGGRTVSWGSQYTFTPDAPLPTLSTVGGYTDTIEFVYDAIDNVWVAFKINLAAGGGGGSQASTVNISGAVGRWVSYCVDFSKVQAAALTKDVTLFNLPYKTTIHKVVIKHWTNFTGGAIASCTVQVGITGNNNKYAGAFDIFQAVTDTTFGVNNNFGMETFQIGTSTPIIARFTSTGANLSALTQGYCEIYLYVSSVSAIQLPGYPGFGSFIASGSAVPPGQKFYYESFKGGVLTPTNFTYTPAAQGVVTPLLGQGMSFGTSGTQPLGTQLALWTLTSFAFNAANNYYLQLTINALPQGAQIGLFNNALSGAYLSLGRSSSGIQYRSAAGAGIVSMTLPVTLAFQRVAGGNVFAYVNGALYDTAAPFSFQGSGTTNINVLATTQGFTGENQNFSGCQFSDLLFIGPDAGGSGGTGDGCTAV